MTRLSKIFVMACVAISSALASVGCSGPKAIPDKDLVKIFHDAFLANAYILECNITEDSLLLYEPILARYGYTVEDMQHTVNTIASRKSSRLSDLVGDASLMLEEESKIYNYQLRVLDTIDNVAKRHYTRIMYSDSLIRVRKLSDSTKLHITLSDLVPGEYIVEFEYHIDTTDENRNSRVEAFLRLNDGTEALRHTMMLSRYRDAKYTRKFTVDTTHNELYVNIFYHPKSEEPKKPDIKVRNFKITRVIPTEQAVDSLFMEQMGALMFNKGLMTSFVEPKEERAVVTASEMAAIRNEAEPEEKPAEKPQPKPAEKSAEKPQPKPQPKPADAKKQAATPTPKTPAKTPSIKPGGTAPGARPAPNIAPGGKPTNALKTGAPDGRRPAPGKTSGGGKRPTKVDPTKSNS